MRSTIEISARSEALAIKAIGRVKSRKDPSRGGGKGTRKGILLFSSLVSPRFRIRRFTPPALNQWGDGRLWPSIPNVMLTVSPAHGYLRHAQNLTWYELAWPRARRAPSSW